jgi:FKBP-type peptidyl-prolyl cis-trans isomerase
MMKEKHQNVMVETISAIGEGSKYPCKGQTVTVHYIAYYVLKSTMEGNNTSTHQPALHTSSSNISNVKERQEQVQFHSTRDLGRPFQFKLFTDQVIPGLDEGVVQLTEGERAIIDIPSGQAYGEQGFPGLIPPNSNLVFDLELMDSTWETM